MMRKQIRLLGVDDCAHRRGDATTTVVGAFFRGADFLDGVVSTPITVDGDDATRRIASMINKSKFKAQLRAVLLDGIAVGGFNVIDIHELYAKTGIPVIAVVRRYPDFKRIRAALARLGWQHRVDLLDRAGPPVRVGRIFVQFAGISKERVEDILQMTCTNSHIPEPIRAAHLIAGGVKLGESRGRA